jgi:hypothetical protein
MSELVIDTKVFAHSFLQKAEAPSTSDTTACRNPFAVRSDMLIVAERVIRGAHGAD